MSNTNAVDCFAEAKKDGMKAYSKEIFNNQVGYLPSLDELIKDIEIISEVNLGLIEIPLKKIIGTHSHLRSLSFAKNFMPILQSGTDFDGKWISLCGIHLTEGIRDPIKVYEYLNWFYVIEGNKRVSVLKYFDAFSIPAIVIRLIPKIDENDINSRIYFEYLKFYQLTKIHSIWFSEEHGFEKLILLLKHFNPTLPITENNKFNFFEKYIYNTFRECYLKAGGQKLPITTGDAFLEYCNIYGIRKSIKLSELQATMRVFLPEMVLMSKKLAMAVQTVPLEKAQKNVLSTLTTMVMPKKILKVAFAYSRTIQSSGWTYCHELGRLHINKVLGDKITTTYVENVPANEDSYNVFKQLAEDGNSIIFTTSPIFMNATLKCSLDYPNVRFFNCSEYHPYARVSNYFGRTYEPRFLTGLIAGSMTKSNIIGYIATSPAPETISSINAFAIGAKMVNPYCKVKVCWTNEWNSPIKYVNAGNKLILSGADIISNQYIQTPRSETKKFGIYSMLSTIDKNTHLPDKYIAAPIWHWGIFYEKILNNILNDSIKNITDLFNNNPKLINFWWGMDSGVIDIFCSKRHLPQGTEKLVYLMKKMIINGEYHPFTGKIYDTKGDLKVQKNEIASIKQIFNMDWFVDIVEIDSLI